MPDKQNIVKSQHYIPKSLLKYFTGSDGKFFEVLLGLKKIYPSSPNNSMCEQFTYEHEKLEINTVEKFFAKIEDEAVPLVRELVQTIIENKNGRNEFSDIKYILGQVLPTFILFYYRSGALLTEYSSFKKEDKIPLLSKKILNPEYIRALAAMVIKHYNFAIIESEDEFLLSDQFISTAALKIKARFFDISNRHMGLKETLILIPISSSYYAAFWNTSSTFFLKENTINILDENNLKSVNRAIINNSYIKCIGQKQARIEEAFGDYKMEFPSQIFAGGNPPGFSTGAIKKKEVFFNQLDKEAFDFICFSPGKFEGLGRNDLCACQSGKKFKKCHVDIYNRARPIIAKFGDQAVDYLIPGVNMIEEPVDRWSGFANPKLLVDNKF